MIPDRDAGCSEFLQVRDLRYHVRRYGDGSAPMLFLLHGHGDVSATFQPLVRALLAQPAAHFQVLAPDWRGFGHSEWPQDGYWFPDYVADFDAIAAHYAPQAPFLLVGHSMGGQIASLYAGARPQRVRKLVLLDSLFLPDEPPARVVKRFRSWLEHQNDPRAPRTYASFEELAQRVRRRHPQLSPEKALFVARCWAREDGHGRVLLSADPRHSLDSPRPYRSDESEALWCEITAPTLFLDAAESQLQRLIPAEEKLRRRALIRDHRTIVIPDAGHMLHFDAPDAAAAAIAAFLNG